MLLSLSRLWTGWEMSFPTYTGGWYRVRFASPQEGVWLCISVCLGDMAGLHVCLLLKMFISSYIGKLGFFMFMCCKFWIYTLLSWKQETFKNFSGFKTHLMSHFIMALLHFLSDAIYLPTSYFFTKWFCCIEPFLLFFSIKYVTILMTKTKPLDLSLAFKVAVSIPSVSKGNLCTQIENRIVPHHVLMHRLVLIWGFECLKLY